MKRPNPIQTSVAAARRLTLVAALGLASPALCQDEISLAAAFQDAGQPAEAAAALEQQFQNLMGWPACESKAEEAVDTHAAAVTSPLSAAVPVSAELLVLGVTHAFGSALPVEEADQAPEPPVTPVFDDKDDKDKGDDESGDDESGDDESGDDEGEDEDEGPKHIAIVGGDIYTGTGAVLHGATLLAKDGKIHAIGYDLELPEDTELVDAGGMRVYPGLVACDSSGLLGGGSDFLNTADPFNSRMTLGLAGGITTTGQSNSVVKLKRFTLDGILINEKPLVTLSWSGRNPQSKRSLREKLANASEYLRGYRQWQIDVKQDKELKEPSRRGVDLNVLKVLQGESRARFNANSRDDLLGIARLAQQYHFRPVIDGCYEGWTVADELGRAGATAVVTPRTRRTQDERMSSDGGSSIENAAKLYRAGVQVAIQPQSNRVDLGGIVGRDIIHLPIEAGFAVRGGLPDSAALEAMTIVPARILGVDHRIGSLEVGKDCDLIVTDGDVMHYETFTQYAVVDGRVVYDKQKELYYAHIRPRPESALAPADKLDAGEIEEVVEEPADEEGEEETESETEED